MTCASGSVHGKHFTCDTEEITIFGITGRVMDNGSWVIDGRIHVPANSSVRGRVQDCLSKFIWKGRIREIGGIQLAPRVAVAFFLENGFTSLQLQAAREHEDCFDIFNVFILDYPVTLRVHRDPQPEIAAIDQRGQVI